MKKMNKKGFTIVELVIVIAVIAVLAGVMIPTFTGLVETANDSARTQIATAAYKDAYAVALASDGVVTNGESATSAGITFTFSDDGKDATCVLGSSVDAKLTGCTVSVADGVVTVVAPE